MTYFSSKNLLINQDNKIIIQEMSKKYIYLKILEINWENFVDYEKFVDGDLCKNINIYFQGKLKNSIHNPDYNQIYDLFEHCKKFYEYRIKQELKLPKPIKGDLNIKPYSLTSLKRERKNRKQRMNRLLKNYNIKQLEECDFINIKKVLNYNNESYHKKFSKNDFFN